MNTGKYKSPYDGGATGEAKQMNKIVFSFSNFKSTGVSYMHLTVTDFVYLLV